MDHILVIEDDRQLCQMIVDYLTAAGFRVEVVHDAGTGLEAALAREHALLVMATPPPGVQRGFDLLRHLRARCTTPVVLLTSRNEEVDRILGLEMGADDCLSKPFNPRELLARIHAILRRVRGVSGQQQQPALPPALRAGDIYLEPAMRIVRKGAVPLDLTAAEFALLEILVRRMGQVVRREELADHVLGRKLSESDRCIDTHVSRLRKKLGRNGSRERIKTIRNIGYLYVLPQEDDQFAASKSTCCFRSGTDDAADAE
ncbi:MAG: response regulator transcription factor [candidate division NC10 bacterium]|nr:response regulator transcription factor [candidate division NC10 bacterium]